MAPMQDRIDAALATPAVVSTSLHIYGVPLTDVAITLNVIYILVLLWLKVPDIIERIKEKIAWLRKFRN